MLTYTQASRPFRVTTPLGKDVLLLTGFRGEEAISQLFSFQLDLLAETQSEIHFDRIVGQNVTVEMRFANEEKRYFNGMVKRFSQGARDESFVHFRAELVPKLWLLTKKVRSCIFQHLSVPGILRQVFSELDVTYEISGTYYPRDYCVQYRESDFDFASRLMEEEGIYYFFKHRDASHEMVVTDMANQHPSVPGQSNVVYEEISGGVRKDMRVTSWEKTQELRSGEYTLWDHSFELPGKNLQAKRKTIDSVAVGEVSHKLSVGGNDQLKIYDYPGGYAQRFGGIDRNGAARPQDLKNIFPDSERTVRIRMEQEEVHSLAVTGASNCGHFVAGHKFALERHFDADDQYLLTRVEHDARFDGNYRSNQALAFHYENRFTCIPVALPYRPHRVTRKPVIAGVQTATVVGPRGEKIFCDKYGRVKVQFHWDREGKKDADSSCWLRITGVGNGRGRGTTHIPLVGDEVVVGFLEGDPDRPIIFGSVYNAAMMPPLDLPANKTKSIIRDYGGNEIVMEGAGEQQIKLYSPHVNTTLTMGGPGSGFRLTTDKDWDSKISGNKEELVFGHNKTKIISFSIEHLLGFNTKFIGGVKEELVAGAELKQNFVSKAEIIRGATLKSHVGPEYKHEKSKKVEKNPSLLEQVKSVKSFYSDCVRQIRGKWAINKAAKAQIQANEIRTTAKNWIGEWGAEAKMKADTWEVTAKNSSEKATKIEKKSNDMLMQANLTVNNGTFTVKK